MLELEYKIHRKVYMKNYFNNNIKPLNDDLGRKLGIKKITVKQLGGAEDISIEVDGWCNHAGAELQDVITERYDTDSGRFIPDDSEEVLVCKCGSQYIDGDWV